MNNYNIIYPVEINKKTIYERLNWTLGDSYDPNWYINGTDRHM